MISSKWRNRCSVALAAVGLLTTLALGWHVDHKPPVYYSDTQVRFVPPLSKFLPNRLIVSSASLIAVASAVGRMVVPDPPDGQVVSPTVTLVDQGVRNGWSLTLPNDGGQFTNYFDQPYLRLQVVGGSPREVQATVRRITRRIDAKLTKFQNHYAVAPSERISTLETPSVLQITELRGSRVRALSAVLVLGLGLTLIAEMFLHRWFDRRSSQLAARPLQV